MESADKDVQARELVNNPHTNVSASDAISTLTFFTVLIQKKVALLKEHVDEKKRGGLSPEQIAEIHANVRTYTPCDDYAPHVASHDDDE